MDNLLTVDSIGLHVERCGKGEPLLLVPGLGAGTWLWSKNVEALSKHFHLIMPELRGSGRSDKPDSPYSIALFASDLKAVLDQLDIYKTNVLGVSMGGLIAQYFAATWPDRLQGLVLAATSLGGQSQKGPDGSVLCRLIRPRGRTRKERLEDAYQLNFTREFIENHQADLDKITEWRTLHPQPEFAYYRQLLAGNAYDGAALAGKIVAPTLIFAGTDDQLVPPDDVRAVHKKIARSELVLVEGKHLFLFEQHEKFNDAVIRFFKQTAIGQKTRTVSLTK